MNTLETKRDVCPALNSARSLHISRIFTKKCNLLFQLISYQQAMDSCCPCHNEDATQPDSADSKEKDEEIHKESGHVLS